MPSACAATLGRERLSEPNRMDRPWPGARSRLARGMRQPSNARLAVLDARVPILCSVPSTRSPSVPFSRMATEMAAFGSSISDHLPNTRYRSATSPLVMKVLPPLMTMSSPSGVKLVRMPVASEPAEGSVIASAASPPSAMRGSRRAFCSSLPYSISGLMAWKFVAQTMPVAAQALETSRTQAR